MAEDRVQRRLAAILAADVEGYSRVMGADKEGALAKLTAHINGLIEPCIAEDRGRMVKAVGARLLVEISSCVDAIVPCVAEARPTPREIETGREPCGQQVPDRSKK